MLDPEPERRGFSGSTGVGVNLGLSMPPPLPPGSMTSSGMRPGIGAVQCRQPPAYKVAAQMARLHRLGRAHSHEGVTYRNDPEDGINTINTEKLAKTSFTIG